MLNSDWNSAELNPWRATQSTADAGKANTASQAQTSSPNQVEVFIGEERQPATRVLNTRRVSLRSSEPPAMRHAVPESNPGLVELLSLGITFPFNITLGIPLYWMAIRWLWGMA
ncbi:MAG: sodium-dependent bicarbonate transport family permease [Kiritimatiellia bacterium]